MKETKAIVVFANDFSKESHKYIFNHKFSKSDKVRIIMIGDIYAENPLIFSVTKMISKLKLSTINTSYVRIGISDKDLSMCDYSKSIKKLIKYFNQINSVNSLIIDTTFSSIELENALYIMALKFKGRSPNTKVSFNNRIIEGIKPRLNLLFNSLTDEDFINNIIKYS